MDWEDVKDIVKNVLYLGIVIGAFALLYLFLTWLDRIQL